MSWIMWYPFLPQRRVGSFATYEAPASTKLVMVLLMWISQIENRPVLVLLTPSYWRI